MQDSTQTGTLLPQRFGCHVIHVNLNSICCASRAAIAHLGRSRGCVVNLGSFSGMFAAAGFVAFTASKSAVGNPTVGMALDFARDGVRVNCVCPGAIDTPMLRPHLREAGIMAEYDRHIPMGRVADPDEVSTASLFLGSDDASSITGVAPPVDGGITAGTGRRHFDWICRERGWVCPESGAKS